MGCYKNEYSNGWLRNNPLETQLLRQRGKMTSSKNIIKSVTAKDYLVVSAKVPEWFFNTIDIFKEKQELGTRNAAIAILISAGLRDFGLIDAHRYEDLIAKYGQSGSFSSERCE